ncbi:dynein intermediate chain 3, ciliary [Colletes latitarsis]|uniref:dynein intermediate chain 3, ciliary n=1 Tax=Colletes latitarsis TaxID=2605962 RepID=UPI00403628A5
MEIRKVYVKMRAEFGKQCIFDTSDPVLDVDIKPDPTCMNDYVLKSHCYVGVQHSKQLALHGVQTSGITTRNTGMFHFEGGWPKEIDPRDEETTARFRRRIEKDDNWAPKLHNLFKIMEQSVLQNGAVNIYQHYFEDMIPTGLVQPLDLRVVNVYADPETPKRPITNISWSPDRGSRIVVSYCFLKFGRQPDYSHRAYIWQVANPNQPYMALEPFSPCVVCEFNPRDPSVLASGLMTGQVCSWDIRTGRTPVESSDLQFSHREYANAVKWLPTKSNTEFFSTSSDGCTMWWDTRWIRKPTETLMFDLEMPNEPHMNRAMGISCLNYGPMIGTKFVLGMDNGVITSGTRRGKTNAEKIGFRYNAHFGPVVSVDRNNFNPGVFLSVGDWTARVWSEDTREGNLVSTLFLRECPTAGCWNKSRHSVFYVATDTGALLAWDLLHGFKQPIFTLQLSKERLTAIAPAEEGTFVAIGNSVGQVFLIESMDYLQSFDRKDRATFAEYIERYSKLTKAVDVRLKEIKLAQKIQAEEEQEATAKDKEKGRSKRKTTVEAKQRERESKVSKEQRRSISREIKRKPREDLSAFQFVDAEQKYFKMVEQELEKYVAENDPDVCPAGPQFGTTKKQERRQRRRSLYDEDESKDDRKKDGKKMSMRESVAAKRKKSRKMKQLPQRDGQSSKQSMREDSFLESKTKIAKEKATMKKRKRQISFVLPVPCKGEICKPKVCCFRTRKKEKRIGKLGADRKLSTDKSSRESLRGSRKRTKASVFSKMLDLPLELTREVERARREIAEAKLSGGRLERRRSTVDSISEDSR